MSTDAATVRRMGLAQHSARVARARNAPPRRKRPAHVIPFRRRALA